MLFFLSCVCFDCSTIKPEVVEVIAVTPLTPLAASLPPSLMISFQSACKSRYRSTILLSVSSESNSAKQLWISAKRCCQQSTEASSPRLGKDYYRLDRSFPPYIDWVICFGHIVIPAVSSRRIDPRIRIIFRLGRRRHRRQLTSGNRSRARPW